MYPLLFCAHAQAALSKAKTPSCATWALDDVIAGGVVNGAKYSGGDAAKDAATATQPFTLADSGLHFKYSDIGAASYKSLPKLADAVNAFLTPEEKALLGGRLVKQDAWHIQSGTGGMIVHAGVDNDLAFGGTNADGLWGGGGIDILIGGANNDVLVGEAGNDTLLGGMGNGNTHANTGNEWRLAA